MTNRKSELDALLQPSFSDSLLHIVTFATDADQDKLRTFMAFLHHQESSFNGVGTQYSIRTNAVIYYVGNNDVFLSEISLWDNTHVVHVNKQLVKMSHGNDDTLSHSVENWRPFCIKHAVDLFGSALFVDVDIIVTGDLSLVLNSLIKHGSYLVIRPEEEPTWERRVQGYSYKSSAYNTILQEQLKCFEYFCSLDVSKSYQTWKRSHHFSNFPRNIFGAANQQAGDFCHIRHPNSVLYVPPSNKMSKFLKKLRNLSMNTSSAKKIAVGVPVTSNRATNLDVDNTPFLSIFLPSFLESIDKNDGYEYIILLGADKYDPLYDDPIKQKEIQKRFQASTVGHHVSLKIHTFAYSRGWVVHVWNGLFEAAVKLYGTGYFYQVNDDTRFISNNWTNEFVGNLQSSQYPNIGVTGPKDLNNQRILTCSFVSVEHYLIFGAYYPPIFHNWYSDDWITMVYQNKNLLFKTEKMVVNTNVQGTRYVPCNTKNLLEATLKETSIVLKQYLFELIV